VDATQAGAGTPVGGGSQGLASGVKGKPSVLDCGLFQLVRISSVNHNGWTFFGCHFSLAFKGFTASIEVTS
jgi:hypothetical protein